MKKSSLSVLLLVFFFLNFSAFAEIEFLSPAPGVWGNKQMLVIDNEKDGEYYYSINGSDPEKSGFAYDGPVLLDISGDVVLKVAYVSADGTKDFGKINYTVTENDGSYKGSLEKAFVATFAQSGFYDYITGEQFNIPGDFQYSLEKNPVSFIPGTLISISSQSIFKELLPCTVEDVENNVKWRFLIKVNPFNMGILSKREVPFSIENWDTITFNNDQLLYKIDSEYWGLPEEPRVIDRSVSHMISWQSIEYKAGNPVEYFVLPPEVQVGQRANEDGSISFYIDSDLNSLGEDFPEGENPYTLGIIDADDVNGTSATELFTNFDVDVFYGDKTSGELNIGIFANTVYQGKVSMSYDIDKQPPAKPVISSSSENFYSRNGVKVSIPNVEGADLYVAVSEPLVIKNDSEIYKEDNQFFNNAVLSEFTNYSDGSFAVDLLPVEGKAVYYKVASFTEKGNYRSPLIEYGVVVDQSSYYYNKNSGSTKFDGTSINPFITFEQCVEAIKDSKSVSLRVTGDLYIDKKYKIDSNLKIINSGNGRIIFGPKGSIEMSGATLDITDCRIHKIPDITSTTLVPFFKLRGGNLDLKNCQIAADFSKNGTVVEAVDSIVNIQDSIISVSADLYASFISCVDSRVSIFNSSITATGGTCVIISANNGELSIFDNKFKLIGTSGRIAELFGVNASFENNEFKGDLSKSNNMSPIFSNKKTILIDKGNNSIGF